MMAVLTTAGDAVAASLRARSDVVLLLAWGTGQGAVGFCRCGLGRCTTILVKGLQLLDLRHQGFAIGQQLDNRFMPLRLIGRDAEGEGNGFTVVRQSVVL